MKKKVSKKKAGIVNIADLRAAVAKHTATTSKGAHKGLILAGLFLQRESQKLVPVDTAVLKNTATTRAEGKGLKTQVIVGYGTNYAIYVHEDLEARHKPGKQAKFLEEPLRKHRQRLAEIVRKGIVG